MAEPIWRKSEFVKEGGTYGPVLQLMSACQQRRASAGPSFEPHTIYYTTRARVFLRLNGPSGPSEKNLYSLYDLTDISTFEISDGKQQAFFNIEQVTGTTLLRFIFR